MTNEELRQLQLLPRDQQLAYLLGEIEECQQWGPPQAGCWTPHLNNLQRLVQLQALLRELERSA
ncbi:MAG: hypothetical protein RLZZ555_517 [Pseudomonadota bacterium]|jgi:hypothetical protein